MTNEQILDSYEDQRAISPADSKDQDYCKDCDYYKKKYRICIKHDIIMDKYEYCIDFKEG